MTQPPLPDPLEGKRRFRRNLIRVMTVQVIALMVLWMLQRHFTT